MTLQELELQYQDNIQRIQTVFTFVMENHYHKENIQYAFNSKALIQGQSTKDKIRVLFIDAINAAGASNLSRNGPSCQLLFEKLSPLPNDLNIPLGEFYNCFDENVNSLQTLFNYLSNGLTFGNFREKKAALFLNKIHWMQNVEPIGRRLFTNYEVSEMELMIPIDSVITFILNRLFKFEAPSTLDQYRDFGVVNQFFKSHLGSDFLNIEDLWFWGYFSTIGGGRNRVLQFNTDKYYTAEFITPNANLQGAVNDFIQLLS